MLSASRRIEKACLTSAVAMPFTLHKHLRSLLEFILAYCYIVHSSQLHYLVWIPIVSPRYYNWYCVVPSLRHPIHSNHLMRISRQIYLARTIDSSRWNNLSAVLWTVKLDRMMTSVSDKDVTRMGHETWCQYRWPAAHDHDPSPLTATNKFGSLTT